MSVVLSFVVAATSVAATAGRPLDFNQVGTIDEEAARIY